MPEIERATEGDDPIDETELAAGVSCPRPGTHLDACRHDLRAFFQWAGFDVTTNRPREA